MNATERPAADDGSGVPRTEQPAVSDEPRSPDTASPRAWYTLFALVCAAVLANVGRQLLVLAAAPVALALGLSDGDLGFVQGLVYSSFAILSTYPLSWLADRIDRRVVVGTCIVLSSLGTLAFGLARDFPELIAASALVAAGIAGLSPVVASIVPDLFRGRQRVVANSIQYVSSFVGVALALAVGGIALGALERSHAQMPDVLRAWESWRIAFFCAVLPAPLLLASVAFMNTRRHAPAAAREGAKPAGDVRFGRFLVEHRSAIGRIFGALWLYSFAFGGFLIWLPVAAARIYGATPAQNGVGMGLAVGAGVMVGVAISTVALRGSKLHSGRSAAVTIAWRVLLIATPVLFGFSLAGAVWQLYALMGGLMAAGTSVGVLATTMLQDMTPSAIRARFVAFYTIGFTLLGGGAPSIVGLVSGAIGSERSVLYALSVVALPSWLGAIVLMRAGESDFVRLRDAVRRHDSGR